MPPMFLRRTCRAISLAARPARVMRDVLCKDVDKLVAGSVKLKEYLDKLMSLNPASARRPVVLHNTGRDMMDETTMPPMFLRRTCRAISLAASMLVW